MPKFSKWVFVVLASCLLLFLGGIAAAQETTSKTEMKMFEVVSVDGNKVVARGPDGTKEYTLPDDFKLQMDGKDMAVKDLQPGMKVSAMITTTTTTHPVTVTEVRHARVVARAGNSVIVQGPKGNRTFTSKNVNGEDIKIYVDGKRVDMSQLQVGDMLTATIVTNEPPTVTTTRQVKADVVAAPKPAPAAAPAAEPAPAPAAPAPAPAPAKLPKTGSSLPLVAWLGALSLAAGLGLTATRRSRIAR